MVSLPPAAGMEGEASKKSPLTIFATQSIQILPRFTPIYMKWDWPYIFPYIPITLAPQPTITGWTSFWELNMPWKEENRAASWAQNHVFSTEREPHFLCAILILSLFLVIDTEHSKKLFLKSHRRHSSALGHGVSHWGDISVECSKT